MDIKSQIGSYFSSKPVLKAYLFGSYARGAEDDSSDVDVLVELDKEVDLFSFIRMKNELEEIVGRPVDLVSAKGLSQFIKPFVDKEKILIYEK